MDNGASEGVSKEIPVEQQTVDAIASQARALMGRRFLKAFRVGKPEEKTTLEILNYPVAPWRRHHTDGRKLGREMYLKLRKIESVFTDVGMEDKTTITAMRLDTRRGDPPTLRINPDTTGSYIESEKDRYLTRLQTNIGKPSEKRYITPTEEKALEVLNVLKKIIPGSELEHMLSTTTVEDRKDLSETRTQLVQEARRIISAAEGYTYENFLGTSIKLALDQRTVTLMYGESGDAIQVSISEPTNEGSTDRDTVSENYTSVTSLPLSHDTHFTTEGGAGSSRATTRADADIDQTNYLFGVLEMLTDERVKRELSVRTVITQQADGILDRVGIQGEKSRTANIKKENFTVHLYKSTENGLISVTVTNFVDEAHPTDNEDDVREQEFLLYPGNPLQVTTYKYGEEVGVGKGVKTLATDHQTAYFTTLLEELAQNPSSSDTGDNSQK